MRIFFRAPIFLFGLQAHSNKNSNTSPVSAKCRLQTGYKMQTKSLYCFFVRYVITCHLTTYQASRNRFSAIIFHDYLQYCGIFLARFLITVVLNIISSLHIVFSFCARVGWCDVGTEFTHLIKVDATSSPTQPFSNSHHDVRTSFLITQLLENKRKFYPISLESSHKRNSTVPIFNKSKKSIQT